MKSIANRIERLEQKINIKPIMLWCDDGQTSDEVLNAYKEQHPEAQLENVIFIGWENAFSLPQKELEEVLDDLPIGKLESFERHVADLMAKNGAATETEGI